MFRSLVNLLHVFVEAVNRTRDLPREVYEYSEEAFDVGEFPINQPVAGRSWAGSAGALEARMIQPWRAILAKIVREPLLFGRIPTPDCEFWLVLQPSRPTIFVCERRLHGGALAIHLKICPGLNLELHPHSSFTGFMLVPDSGPLEEWLTEALSSSGFNNLSTWFDLRTAQIGGRKYFLIRKERLSKYIRELRGLLQRYATLRSGGV